MLSGLAMKTRDPPRPLETWSPLPSLLPSFHHPLLELMLLLLPKETKHTSRAPSDVFLVLWCFVCALSRVFPPNNTKGSSKFCRCSNTIRLISGFAGSQRGGWGALDLLGFVRIWLQKRPYAVPRPLPLNRPISNGTWRCAALRCSDLVWAVLQLDLSAKVLWQIWTGKCF